MNESDSAKKTANKPKSALSAPVIVGALIAIALGAWLSSQFFASKQSVTDKIRNAALTKANIISGTFLRQTKSLSDFKLTDHNGNDFTVKSLKGHWTFLFFGYTHCPDVCPNTLAVLKIVADQLEKNPMPNIDFSNTRFVFVSVDPARDTPNLLKKFVQYFNLKFIGITGPHPALQRLTKQIGILYSVEDKKKNKNYMVDHSAHLVLINPKAHFQALFSYPHDVRKLVKDYQTIRKIIKD